MSEFDDMLDHREGNFRDPIGVRESDYGYASNGCQIHAPQGWKVLPEGQKVPHVHREFTTENGWGTPKRTISTMTPINAGIYGSIRAIAVPE